MGRIGLGRWGAALALTLAGATAARAQDVRVRKTGGEKSAFDFSGLAAEATPAAREFATVLRTSLLRSGWFAAAAPGRGEYRLTGAIAARGDGLDARLELFETGSARRVLGKRYAVEPGSTRRRAHEVADEIVRETTGRPGFAASRLAVIGRRGAAKELFVCDSDGAGLRQITRDNTLSLYPRWSPDGARIVYTSYLRRAPDVLMLELATGRRVRLSGFAGLNAGGAFSPDGRYSALILSRDGNPELYVKRLADGALTRLTNTPRAAESSPSWSPDGREIVYVSDLSGRPQLYVVGRDGGAPRRLTARGAENVAPDWGPDGRIAHAARLGGVYQLCVTHPGTGETQQLALDYADWEDPSWARDGRHLAAARRAGGRSAVYLVDTMGDPPIALLEEGEWFSPAWSP